SPCGPTPVGVAARKLCPSSLERRTKTVRPIVEEASQIVPSSPTARFGATEAEAGSIGAAAPKARPPVGRNGAAAWAAAPFSRRTRAAAAAARSDPMLCHKLPGRVSAYPVHEQAVEAVGELVRVRPGAQPRVRPVRGRERKERRGRVVEVGAELTELTS